ncbi:ribbon-helix-helix domain-containing protein [Microaerobacter geothermalis]|uniref:ribbon-helix-helix domain-containing protein n=1 Tax=Microaerobacter geothermalis TaxID=674972 RepID=UPI0038B2FDCF|nr:ribbon-helix-helix domain-containing protein [Microaerobacter geothermalis]
MPRKNVNTTLDEELYKKIRLLALKLQVNANDLIEEGMRYILKKYENKKDASTKQ